MYTETFTFYFGHYCLDSLGINMYPPFYFFCPKKVLFLPPKKSFSSCGGRHEQFFISPFIFNSLYQVGTAVCRSCGYVTTNIWEMSGSWAFLQASILQICPHTAFLRFPWPPQSLSAPQSPHNLRIS